MRQQAAVSEGNGKASGKLIASGKLLDGTRLEPIEAS